MSVNVVKVLYSCVLAVTGTAVVYSGTNLQFKSSAEVVQVDVSVTRKGRPVAGLESADFLVRDNGQIQKITAMQLSELPLHVMLVLDMSGSVRGDKILQLRSAMEYAVGLLRREDRFTVIAFSQGIGAIAVDPVADGATRRIVDGFAGLRPGGATSLHDAIFAALVLRWGDQRRPVIIVLSDGEDTASWLDADAIMEQSLRSDTVIYSVLPGAGRGNRQLDPRDLYPTESLRPWFDKNRQIARRALLAFLSRDTGGEVMFAGDQRAMSTRLSGIMQDFRERYLLSYSPSNVDAPGWHSLDVRVKRRGLSVLARRGYRR